MLLNLLGFLIGQNQEILNLLIEQDSAIESVEGNVQMCETWGCVSARSLMESGMG